MFSKFLCTVILCVTSLSEANPSNEEAQHYYLVKDLRRKGFTCPDGTYFPPNPGQFAFDCRVWRAARAYAQDMASNNFFDHIDRSGRNPCDRTKATGLEVCSENIAAGQDSAQSALDAFKASTHHCPNMMDPKLNRIGVGFSNNPSSTYKFYWVQNMGTNDGAVEKSCNPPYDDGGSQQPTPSGCSDKDPPNCKPYIGYAGSQYCQSDWTKINCRKTCGLC